jgi:hypothetical protein
MSKYILYQMYMKKNHNKIIDYNDFNRHKLTGAKTYKQFEYIQRKEKEINKYVYNNI